MKFAMESAGDFGKGQCPPKKKRNCMQKPETWRLLARLDMATTFVAESILSREIFAPTRTFFIAPIAIVSSFG
jgi:hypothetical protein